MTKTLQDLFTQLNDGDLSVAGEVFLRFEPYLRKAVRRYLTRPLRVEFDSSDILQSVWADVFHGFQQAGWRFRSPDHLRGFLFVAIRNRLIDRVRRHERDQRGAAFFLHGDWQHCRPAPPRPSEMASAQEIWERLLALCPPEHRAVLDLRRQGYTLTEIAEQTGLHPDSVRRILRTLARRLAFRPALGAAPAAEPPDLPSSQEASVS